jgi:hypothetical protein
MRGVKQVFGVICLITSVFGGSVENLPNNTTNENKAVFLKAPLPNDGAAHAKETQSNAKLPCVDCSLKKQQ